LLPAIAFALDMIRETNNNFGVNEVLLSSVLAAVMFSLLAGQPLCIVGVTGTQPPFN
jgi:NADH:ubiquinone oxidoreductase subunit 6 (subunit J)